MKIHVPGTGSYGGDWLILLAVMVGLLLAVGLIAPTVLDMILA